MRQESVEKDNGAVSGRFVPEYTRGADIDSNEDSGTEGDLFSELDATNGAKQLAEAEDINLAEVEGTGKDGRITKADVKRALS